MRGEQQDLTDKLNALKLEHNFERKKMEASLTEAQVSLDKHEEKSSRQERKMHE